MMIKKYIIILLLVMAGVNSYASHLLGGEFSYRCLGGNNYEINLTIYRNCVCQPGSPQCADFDDAAKITIFNNELPVDTVNLSLDLATEREVLCRNTAPDICVERSTGYSTVINLPPSVNNYTLVYMRCCRNENIVNIANPAETGSTYVITIPNSEIAACNSSPTFNAVPQISLRAGFPFIYDHSATDIDGDSLVYQLCTPFDYPLSIDNNVYGPAIRPGDFAPAPPYEEIEWRAFYNVMNQLDEIKIDAATGLIEAMPTTRGEFIVGVCVSEFRNDTLLGSVMRDFQYSVHDEQFNNCNCPDSLLMTWCKDANLDGLGNPLQTIRSCVQPETYVSDCSDENDLVSIPENYDHVFSIYPNPSKGVFKIELANRFSEAYFSLYNTSGQLIIKPTVLSPSKIWQPAYKLSNGVYYVQVQFDGLVALKKLMVVQ